tara:strand:- start:2284 stop:2505 length:222 start_codon:yes stop_codon:yes gene_type:complete
MIRWYDWIAAVIYAYATLWIFLAGITLILLADSPILFPFIAYGTYWVWQHGWNFYMGFRVALEATWYEGKDNF